jgi:hypothetical protein
VTRQTRHLPAAQTTKNTFGQCLALFLQPGNLVTDIQRIVIANQAKLFDLGLKVSDRLFEIEIVRVHEYPSCNLEPAAGSPTLKDQADQVEAGRSIIEITASTLEAIGMVWSNEQQLRCSDQR